MGLETSKIKRSDFFTSKLCPKKHLNSEKKILFFLDRQKKSTRYFIKFFKPFLFLKGKFSQKIRKFFRFQKFSVQISKFWNFEILKSEKCFGFFVKIFRDFFWPKKKSKNFLGSRKKVLFFSGVEKKKLWHSFDVKNLIFRFMRFPDPSGPGKRVF